MTEIAALVKYLIVGMVVGVLAVACRLPTGCMQLRLDERDIGHATDDRHSLRKSSYEEMKPKIKRLDVCPKG